MYPYMCQKSLVVRRAGPSNIDRPYKRTWIEQSSCRPIAIERLYGNMAPLISTKKAPTYSLPLRSDCIFLTSVCQPISKATAGSQVGSAAVFRCQTVTRPCSGDKETAAPARTNNGSADGIVFSSRRGKWPTLFLAITSSRMGNLELKTMKYQRCLPKSPR